MVNFYLLFYVEDEKDAEKYINHELKDRTKAREWNASHTLIVFIWDKWFPKEENDISEWMRAFNLALLVLRYINNTSERPFNISLSMLISF